MRTVEFSLTSHERAAVRHEVISKWLGEAPGTKYRYNVETLKNDARIYLLRPAGLNKGCDFVIVCENFLKFQNGRDKPPRHQDMLNELRGLINDFHNQKRGLLKAIVGIWNCNPPETILGNLNGPIVASLKLERLLKIFRWMFIEQDVTYWANSGRNMLLEAIKEKFS